MSAVAAHELEEPNSPDHEPIDDVSTPAVIPAASPSFSAETAAVSPVDVTPLGTCGCKPESRTSKKKRRKAQQESGEPIIEGPRAVRVKVLADQRRRDGRIPEPILNREAAAMDLNPDYLSRLIRQFIDTGSVPDGRPGSSKKIVLPDVHKAQVAFFLKKGNAVEAFKFLGTRNLLPTRMDLRTFQRRVNEWDPALRACAKGGYRAMVEHQFFNLDDIPYRTYAYGTDHTFLPIMVVTSRGSTKPVWVWLTTVIDLRTRVVLAYKITLNTPNAKDSIDALVEAIHGWYTEDGMFVGGKPGHLRSDRGGDYLSDAFSLNLLNLDIEPQLTEPYSSWQNGEVERLNGTIDSDFAPTIPGFHPGGEAEYTRRVLKTPIPVESLITVETLDRRLEGLLRQLQQPAPLLPQRSNPIAGVGRRQPPHRTSRQGHDHERHDAPLNAKANKYGIEIRGAKYSHPTLALLRRANVTEVEVRYHEHDKDHIEVFVDGRHECTATKTSVQPDYEKLGVLSVRDKQRRQMERLTREADRERVLEERERQREEGTPEEDLPAVPRLPKALRESDEAHMDEDYDDYESNGLDEATRRNMHAHLDGLQEDEDRDTTKTKTKRP